MILTFYPVSVPNYLKKTPKIRFASKKLSFSGKNLTFKFCLLLSRGITGGMKYVYFNVLSHFSNVLSTKKHPNFVLLAKNYFFWQKNLIFKFWLFISRGIIGGIKPFILTFYPVSVSNYLQKPSKFRFASKKKIFFLAKNLIFKSCLLLSRCIAGGMKTIYFNVLSHLSNDLFTKTHPYFVLLAKNYLL